MKKLAELLVKKRFVILGMIFVITFVCGYLMTKVKTNSDMTKYLSDSSNMKKGIDLMSEEFPNVNTDSSIRVMFEGLKAEQKENIVKELEAIKYVKDVEYEIDSKNYNKDKYTLYKVITTYDYDSEEFSHIENTLKKKYENDKVIVSRDGSQATLGADIVAIAVVIALIVLVVMSKSWIEPILFLFTILLAVIINMGTNIFKADVSATTASMAAILQLALSMDYSIILLNRYRQEKKLVSDNKNAMINAIVNAFSSITSSAFTTFVGLLMLVFMSYKLGMDLGIVLAKGVLCSWICIFTVMPSLILIFDKVIEKTAKKSLHVPTGIMARFSYRLRGIMPILFLILFGVALNLQQKTGFMFGTMGGDEISNIFPRDNTVVVLYENLDAKRVEDVVKEFEKDEKITQIVSYPTTIGKEATSEELADMVKDYSSDLNMDINAELLDILYYDYYKKGELPTIAVGELINFISEDVVTNETFSEQLDEKIVEQIDEMKKFADADTLTKKMTIEELAEFFDMKESDLKTLFVLYYSEKGGVDTGKMKLSTFVDFIGGEVMKDEAYASMFDDSVKEQIETLKTFVDKEKVTKKMTYGEAAKLLNMESETVKLLYIYYYAKQSSYKPDSMTINTFVDFMINKVAKDDTFSSQIDKESLAQMKMLQTFTDKSKIKSKLSSSDMAKMLGMDKSMIDLVYAFYHGSEKGLSSKMTLTEFMDFLLNDVMTIEMMSGNFGADVVQSLQQMNQLLTVATSGQVLGPEQLSSFTGIDVASVTAMLGGAPGMTLPDFVSTLIVMMQNPMYQSVFEPYRESLTMLHGLIQAAVGKVDFDASTMANTLGLDTPQVTQLYILHTGMNIKDKKMSPTELVDYLLKAKESGSEIGQAIDKSVESQLNMLQNIMNLAVSGKKLSHKDLASMLDMESSTMKLLYTLHDSYSDTSSWKLSMETIVDFILDNNSTFGSMMDKSATSQLNLAQKLIKGTVKGTKYSAKDMASLLGMDSGQLKQLYLLYISRHGDTSQWGTTPQNLVNFLVNTVLKNKGYAEMFDKDTAKLLNSAKVIIDAVVSEKKYSAEDVTDMLGDLTENLDQNMIELLYLYYGSIHDSDEKWTMSIESLFNHLADEIVKDSRFDGFIDDSFKTEIEDMRKQLQDGIDQLVGDKHSILMINTTYPNESEETYDFIINLLDSCDDNFNGRHYAIGNSVMNHEMKQSFADEVFIITLLTVASIFVIVALTFKSLMIPGVLVLMVQCAVYVTVASMGLSGNLMHYIAYLMVQCILMGATIDYAILFTNYYKEHRSKVGVKDALRAAYAGSIHTIFTSGLILLFVTGIIGVSINDTVLGPTCLTIAIGTFVAIVLILFVLPGTIAIFDKIILKRETKKKIRARHVH